MSARSDIYRLLGSLAVLTISAITAFADDPVVTNTPPAPVVAQAEVPVVQPPPPPPTPAQWRAPFGVEEILTLTRAQIGETLVLNYIKNSGTIYNLQAMDIVHLRDQGVSERIIGAMLDQKATLIAEAKADAPATPATPTTAVNVYAGGGPSMQPAVYALPCEPLPAPSTLHIIPYRAASYAYQTSYRPYGFRPYFNYSPSYYGGWCGASTVLNLHSGFGSHSPSRRGWR